jgi:hypothetical protein
MKVWPFDQLDSGFTAPTRSVIPHNHLDAIKIDRALGELPSSGTGPIRFRTTIWQYCTRTDDPSNSFFFIRTVSISLPWSNLHHMTSILPWSSIHLHWFLPLVACCMNIPFFHPHRHSCIRRQTILI